MSGYSSLQQILHTILMVNPSVILRVTRWSRRILYVDAKDSSFRSAPFRM